MVILMVMEHFIPANRQNQRMFKFILIPLVILLHVGVELLYLLFDNIGYSSNITDPIYFIGDPFGIFLVILAILYVDYLSYLDRQFLKVWAYVNLMRAICYELNDLKIMEHNYNLVLVLIGTVLATVVILI